MKDEVKQGTKETGYSVNYKQPLTEQMVVPTPPLPPWKGKKRVQRSYSSEMLTSDSYYNVNEYCGAETETRQLPTESSGYHSGSLSKQKSATATGKVTSLYLASLKDIGTQFLKGIFTNKHQDSKLLFFNTCSN